MRSLRIQLLALIAVCYFPATDYATSITLAPVVFGDSGGIQQADVLSLQTFDTALGTLNSVNVSIRGIVTATGTMPVNRRIDGLPLPYAFTVNVTQSFTGLGGQFFQFATPSHIAFPGVAPGGTQYNFGFNTGYSYNFTLNSTTDSIGGTSSLLNGPFVSPVFVSGQTSDFQASAAYTNLLDFVQNVSVTAPSHPVQKLNGSVTGVLSLTYNYTARPSAKNPGVGTSPNPLPEPDTMLLFYAGVAGLVGSRLRRKQR